MAEISFGGLNLNDGIIYRVFGPLPIPVSGSDITRLAYARREGSAIAMSRFSEKIITMRGQILGATTVAREASFDMLFKFLNSGQKNLLTGWDDLRYYKANLLGEIRCNRPAGNLYFIWEASFLLADPFAYASTASQLAPVAVTLNLS